jgi:hypothetical protein
MSDDWHYNQRRHEDRQNEKLIESARGYGPGRNDLFAWGFIIGGVLGLVLAHSFQEVLIWAFGGLAVSFVLRLLANLISRE